MWFSGHTVLDMPRMHAGPAVVQSYTAAARPIKGSGKYMSWCSSKDGRTCTSSHAWQTTSTQRHSLAVACIFEMTLLNFSQRFLCVLLGRPRTYWTRTDNVLTLPSGSPSYRVLHKATTRYADALSSRLASLQTCHRTMPRHA